MKRKKNWPEDRALRPEARRLGFDAAIDHGRPDHRIFLEATIINWLG
jgi:hypothetical protein